MLYLPRKQEDVDLQRKLNKDKRELTKEYQEKRSDYDKDLEVYNKLIRKLDGLVENSIEYKNTMTDIDFYLAKLQPKKDVPVVDVVVDVPLVVSTEKPKQKRTRKPKNLVLDLDD